MFLSHQFLPVYRFIIAVLSLAAAVSASGAQSIPAPPRGFGATTAEVVVDVARVLDAPSIAQINALAWSIHADSRGEVVVVTLADLAGRDVGDVALAIGRAWGVGAAAPIGDRARNAGVVVLLVPRETSADGRGYIGIQIGQGAEGFIPDAVAGDIRREATPLLQRGEYGPALALITARLAERYSAEFGFSMDSTLVPPRRVQESEGISPLLLLVAFIVLVSLMNGFGGRRGRRGRRGSGLLYLLLHAAASGRGGWGGGGFGGGSSGGFGGFGGGGGFSGGGSSGSF